MFTIIPFCWEITNDQNGDHNKVTDVFIRIILAIVGAIADWFLFHANVYAGIGLAFAEHFLLFDYVIAAILIEQRVINPIDEGWFVYLGKKGVIDNLDWWRQMNGVSRLIIRLLVFALALLIWFKTSKFEILWML